MNGGTWMKGREREHFEMAWLWLHVNGGVSNENAPHLRSGCNSLDKEHICSLVREYYSIEPSPKYYFSPY